MGRWVGWSFSLAALFVTCVACGNDCDAVADQLRECCARGPAELRKGCEAEAASLEENGNAEACDTALEEGTYAQCQ